MAKTQSEAPALRTSEWAIKRLGYAGLSRVSFWNMVHRSGVPHIRVSPRRILFDEQQIADWLESRSVGGKRR